MSPNHPLLSLCLLSSAALLPAQTWTEVGDAEDLCKTAQATTGQGSMTAITGSLGSSLDADIYLIDIVNPTSFVASTMGGTSIDTMLMLFDDTGRAVTGNDDFGGSWQSRIDGTLVPHPGRYCLAISAFGRRPITPAGEIFTIAGSMYPVLDGAREVLTGWENSGGGSGAYTITLSGTNYCTQQLTLPDNHYLSENPLQTGNVGSAAWWRSTGGRFQVLYEQSHFTNAGVSGPITIRRLRFRVEDGEPNFGGAVWSGAQVRVAATALTSGTLGTTFATNLLAATTTAGPLSTVNLTMQPARGSVPNNDSIIIDLASLGAPLTFDPTGARPNLLIDITLPNAAVLPPAGGAVPAFADTTGGTALVRGAGLTTATPASATGTLSTAPPIVGVDFTGGSFLNTIATPARNETYGAACGGSPSSFYQSFLNGQACDLRHLQLVPNSAGTPLYYTVSNASTPVDLGHLNATANSTADDGIVSHNLGFTLLYPGGSTSTIVASCNGFVWLDPAATSSDATPTLGEFLGTTFANRARLAPCWLDFHCGRNTTVDAQAGLHVQTDTSGGAGHAVCYVTWYKVGLFDTVLTAGQASHTVPCVLHEDSGVVEYRYGGMPRFCVNSNTSFDTLGAIAGWTRGRIGSTPSVDPQSRDLSVELPFSTAIEGSTGNVGLAAVTSPGGVSTFYGARAIRGQSMAWDVFNLPAGTVLGALLLDFAATRPGFALPTITGPGCMLSTTGNTLLWEVNVLPPSTVSGSVPLYVPAGFDGVELHAQYVVLDGLFGAPDLISAASNAILHTVGRQ
ncbi:MAG: hypothetical protein JNN13_11545 [Planctomycetes bacterium]|nr:hypothetical protein [Planctomycetota bacterium]